MNKRFSNFLIVLLCIVVLSIGIGGTFIKNNWSGWRFWEDKGNNHQELNKEINIEMKTAEEIYIDSKTAKITIIPEERQDVLVSLNGSITSFLPISQPELDANNDGKRITIKLNDNNKIISGINNIKLDVHIPKNYNKDMKINNITGSVNAADMTINILDIETVTGKIVLSNLIINKLTAFCTTGSIEANNVKTNETEAKFTTGQCKLNDFSGNIEAKGTTGSMDINYKEFNNDIKAAVTTGSININIPKNSEFKLSAHTSTGKISCDFPININESSKSNLIGQVGSVNNSIDLDVTTGSISIN